jgi:hypothetical protein
MNKNDYVSLAAISPPLWALFLGSLMLLAGGEERTGRKYKRRKQE